MIAELEKVQEDIEKGRIAEALDRLLEVWRGKKATEIADVVDVLGAAFPAPPIEGANPNLEWMNLAREGRASDLNRLLATAVEAGPISALLGRVEQLAARPEDPRIAMAFAGFALDPPTTSSSNFPVWSVIFATLTSTADARVAPILQKRLAMKPGASKFWPKLANGLTKILKKLPAAPALSKDEAKAVAKLAAAAKKVKPAKVKVEVEAAPKKKAAATSGDPMERAIAAIGAGELDECCEALLELWRGKRLVSYARAIDRVTAIHDEGRACPNSEDAWNALAKDRKAIDVGRLAASCVDGQAKKVDERLEGMTTWPEDPRIGRAMFVAFESLVFADRPRTWNLVGDLLVRNVDARMAEALEGFQNVWGENKAWKAARRKYGKAALAALATKEPTAEEAKASAKLEEAIDAYDASRPVTERGLLEAILASPKENGPRLVYSDWLIERGHPRGELITLQCADEPDANKIKELQSAHARTLLGPAACLPYSSLAYELGTSKKSMFDRGLLAKIDVRYNMPAWLYEGHPHLWFIEEVNAGRVNGVVAAAVAKASRSLRHFKGGIDAIRALAGAPEPLAIERVGLHHFHEVKAPLAEAFQKDKDGIDGIGLSKVKHFEISWYGPTYLPGLPDRLVRSPLFESLESLTVSTEDLASVLAALKKYERKVALLTLSRSDAEYALDVTLDAKLVPKKIALRSIDGEARTVQLQNELSPLTKALVSLKLPQSTKLVVASNLNLDATTQKTLEDVVTL